jgi:TRAP-type C4-dicarboxylate transport system substrate-binding protein
MVLNDAQYKRIKMKALYRLLGCLSIVWIVLFNTQQATSKTISLKFASNSLPDYLRGRAEQAFLKEIENQTKGEVSFISYFDSTFLKGEEILGGVGSGAVDLGHVNIAYYPKRLIINSAVYLIQRGPTQFENIAWVYDRLYNELPMLNDEFAKFDQKIVYTYPVLPTAVCFNQPVKRFADFRGKRIRSASRWSLEIMKGMGVVPISSPNHLNYLGLKSNAIEGVLTRYGGIYIGKLDEVAKHIFIARELWTPIPFHITINLNTWNQFPKSMQKKIEVAAEVARNNFSSEYSKWFEWYLNDQKRRGCTIVFADKNDIDFWTSLPEVDRIKDQWIAEAKSVGVDDADQILKTIVEIVSEGIARDQQ